MVEQEFCKPVVDEPRCSNLPSSLHLDLNGTKPLHGETAKTPEIVTLLDPEGFRRLSVSTIADHERISRSPSQVSYVRYASRSFAPSMVWKDRAKQFWQRNRGLWLVALSQFFGALMNVTTRFLELEADGMQPFQILFCRMGITAIFCCLYMWWTNVPDFPFGPRGVRSLLVARGLCGFFGIYGMYYSLQYLPMADATVITFLAPSVAGYACYILIGEPFTNMEQIASYVALAGVVMIARPTSFISFSSPELLDSVGTNTTATATTATTPISDFDITPTNAQRLSAVAVSLLGVLGAAGAYTTIRWIGKRTHPLISVNYFAVWCTLVSTTVLTVGPHLPAAVFSPSLRFALPANVRQWFMLLFLGTCGFIMQFMMTAGIAHEKSNRATNMVYTNMIFALAFDRWIFGTVPGWWSLGGCVCILGSAIWVAVRKGDQNVVRNHDIALMERPTPLDEERAMLGDVDGQNAVQELPVDREGEAESTGTNIEMDDLK